ncbi:NAD-dependent epimerase/dehydratase family protein [Aestuariibius sp. 2305UL40-4]|uniref:NAD-dependent epimerase/dehydratase family protein n=1 Tax=Aestuariibius violaceus TaxID=3234132 RepID=UPI00345ECB0D
MPRIIILGGTGQIGLAAADRFSGEGWDVVLASRTPPAGADVWTHVLVDREDPDALNDLVSDGVELILDCVAFDEGHADQLLQLGGSVGRIAVVSSASVYADAEGRTLDEAPEFGFPEFPVPIPEDHPTVAPGPETYSTRKVALERRLLERAEVPVTILRPCAIHGPYSKHAREWWFVKRLLDGRARIPLAYGGRSRFQTTSTRAIAEALVHALGVEEHRIWNVTDADAPDAAEIGRTIMRVMGQEAELVGLPDAPFPPRYGATPWSTERPLVCASSVPDLKSYAESVPAAIAWLAGEVNPQDWEEALPQLAKYPRDHFDYALDDEALALPGAEPIGA